MTLLSVIQNVCPVIGVMVPTSVFSNLSNNRTMQELLALATEMAQRIAYDTRDWQLLRSVKVNNGDGTTTAFPLPADYKRLLLTSNIWRSTSALTPMRFIPDTDEWINRRALNIYDAWGEWTMLGGQLNIAPTLATGLTVTYAYLTSNCIKLASGGMGAAFQADGDSFALDERLLKLGMIWQWKAQKGSPYNEDLSTYGDALSVAMGHDSPAPILIGRKTAALAARVAYPFPLPTP
ncbi:MAG TPA: hypothetical protein VHT00_14270 [Stellaceae bacterium]|jgi:hypothetical protein|nr:hypothetical protein [Stellaceae bacterium]